MMCHVIMFAERVWRSEGLVGLYRGWLPPLWGSSVYRSMQFAVFEALYTKWSSPDWKREIPYTGGIQLRVLCAGLAASTSRAVIESPVEYAKVRRQTGQAWVMRDIYTGFGMQWARTGGLMTTYFMIIDSVRRHTTLFNSRWGQFVASGGASVRLLFPPALVCSVLLMRGVLCPPPIITDGCILVGLAV